ncbi:MAG: hypothetical protein HFJ38_07725, partial [Bacilli bacterium]|nr:hypothetical protein [Bacilli bacterium]
MKRNRLPLPFYALAAVTVLLLISLVACQEKAAVPTIVMETQYYDRYGNYVEIPSLALPAGEQNDAVDAINAGLNELRERYSGTPSDVRGGNECLFYPSTNDRYLNLVFYEGNVDYGNDGYVCSWVYDKKEGAEVTAEDALALAGTTCEALFADLEAFVAADPEDPRGLYKLFDPINLQGFRIKADGKPVFYLTAVVDGRELENGGYLDEWSRLYVWEDGTFTRYYYMSFGSDGQYPLVPAEETDQFDP